MSCYDSIVWMNIIILFVTNYSSKLVQCSAILSHQHNATDSCVKQCPSPGDNTILYFKQTEFTPFVRPTVTFFNNVLFDINQDMGAVFVLVKLCLLKLLVHHKSPLAL